MNIGSLRPDYSQETENVDCGLEMPRRVLFVTPRARGVHAWSIAEDRDQALIRMSRINRTKGQIIVRRIINCPTLALLRWCVTKPRNRVAILLPTAGENLEVVFKALVGSMSQRLWDSGLPESQTLRVVVLDEKRRIEVYRVCAAVHRMGELIAGRRVQQILMVRCRVYVFCFFERTCCMCCTA